MSSEKALPAIPLSKNQNREHAVVIGGSMAGLLTARVLSDHFRTVTLLERDEYPATKGHRKGQPQAHHLHALLARGLKIIEQLFPGISQELIDAGAQVMDPGNDVIWKTPAGWGLLFRTNITMLSFSRPLVDWHLHRRLAQVENIRIASSCEVTGLISNPDRTNISGVSVKHHSEPGSEIEVMPADLVVDATGRHSRAPEWLSRLGYEEPRETVVNSFLGYATRLYERAPQNGEVDKALYLQAAPPRRTRAGIMFPIEDNRWILTLTGSGPDYPPLDDDRFQRFAESLRAPIIADLIRKLKPIGPARSFRNTENRWRHYEKLSRLPGNFVSLGDSVCAFNPVYGQGMTVAAMGAMELNESVAQSQGSPLDTKFVKRFQKKLAKLNTLPWSLATSEDCRYTNTQGASPTLKTRFMHFYLDHMVAVTVRDLSVRLVWMRVFQMLTPPSALFSPSIVLKVIRQIFSPQVSPQSTRKSAVRTKLRESVG